MTDHSTTTTEAILPLLARLRTMDDGRMAEVIELRIGLADGREHTLQEIGKHYGGLTRERIRQIEHNGLLLLDRFAEEAHIDNLDQFLKELRQTARAERKIYRKNNPPKFQSGPLLTGPSLHYLHNLRRQVDSGMMHLESLGIRI